MSAWLLCAQLVLTAGAENPHLAEAMAQIQALEERKALQTLERAKDWAKGSPRALAQVHLYMGLAHAGLVDEARAVQSFEAALALDRTLQLPPNLSPKVNEWWQQARAKYPAPEVKTPSPAPAAALAPSPPDVPAPAPQTAPLLRRYAGYGLLAAGAAIIGGGVYSGIRAQSVARSAAQEPFGAPALALQEEANGHATTANLLYIGGAVAAGAGAVLVVSGSF